MSERDSSLPARRVRVLNVITRMTLGGAQEGTMVTCALMDRERYECAILTGAEEAPEGDLIAECRERGVAVRTEPALVRPIRPWKDLLALARLVRELRRGRWDVVHLHMSKAGVLGRIAARIAGAPVVVHTAHGWAFTRPHDRVAGRLWLLIERLCARWCDAIVVVAEEDRRAALRLGVGRPEQYRLIRSGIDIGTHRDVALTRESARARLGLPAASFVVISVGRLSEQKAPLDLVAAFARVAAARPEARLVLVGDGPLRPQVEAAIARAGLAARVHVLGARRDVPELMRAADAFALSSRWEGLPRVLPQAMAAGLPIVATRVDGAAEAVADGETGFLVEAGDSFALAERLLGLAADPAQARCMGARGRARVDEFSDLRMARQTEALYDELLATRAPR